MKKLLFPLLALVFITSACSNSTSTKEKDDTETDGDKKKPARNDDEADLQSDPAAMMNAIFKAAKSGDYSALSDFCDPEGDGDVKRICDIENQSSAKQEEFQSYFKKGEVDGDASIEGTEAKVKFTFGPDGDRKEEMNFVKKGKKWYLSSF